ncbi:hypothetical protein HPB50_019770 [Hyalomma asiaticum]|uniref:Uncharacterized protein n=1 Tax=Hyalomma asiaticum TaxID=266040 RepID=A0ACB7RVA4_HYAAI|nr:hypothetical protein HPB50_019770 [Hyalomma asiaticum]
MGSTVGFELAPAGRPRYCCFFAVVLVLASANAWPALDSTTLDSNGSDASEASVVRGATGLPVVCACGADVSKCPAGRTAKTPSRCPPCGLVCARHTGEACSVDEPCAKDFGLSCDPISFTCKAPPFAIILSLVGARGRCSRLTGPGLRRGGGGVEGRDPLPRVVTSPTPPAPVSGPCRADLSERRGHGRDSAYRLECVRARERPSPPSLLLSFPCTFWNCPAGRRPNLQAPPSLIRVVPIDHEPMARMNEAPAAASGGGPHLATLFLGGVLSQNGEEFCEGRRMGGRRAPL